MIVVINCEKAPAFKQNLAINYIESHRRAMAHFCKILKKLISRFV